MTVNTVDITSGPYTGNNTTDEYDYTFRVENKTQLEVFETTDLGVKTLLDVDTDYTVAGIGNDNGGIITRVAGNLPTDYTWFIRSDYANTQETAFRSQGGFLPAVHEAAMDKLTFLTQQLQDGLNSSMRLSPEVDHTGVSVVLPEPVADTTFIWDATAENLIAGPSAAQISAANADAIAAAASAAAASTSEGNAATSETNAAASAVAAAAAVSSIAWHDVVYLTNADSPVTLVAADNGKMYSIDASSGAVTVNLPAISTITLTNPFAIGMKKTDSSANVVTINPNGSETIDGAASDTLDVLEQGTVFIPDADSTPDDWLTMGFGVVPNNALLNTDQTWTGSQRMTPLTDNDGSFDMDAAQDFDWTPAGADVLEFTNETAGQRGMIYLDNSSGYAITLGAEVLGASTLADALSVAGEYKLAYWCEDGTNVMVTASGALV